MANIPHRTRYPFVTVIVRVTRWTPNALLVTRRNGDEVWLPRRSCKLGSMMQEGYNILQVRADIAMQKGFNKTDT